ncbi:MAG: PAS domain S-box protein, partial [Candidatus Cloacimonadaceae bacterium]|nr:PAS domain S-box protein [Candidatus Cloacimonadaceae bacterium]
MMAFIGCDTVHTSRQWRAEDLKILQTAGEIIVNSIARVKNYDDLRESEQKFQIITDNTSDVIWVLSIGSMRHTYISSAVYRLRGCSAEEAINHSLEDTLTPQSCQIAKETIARHLPEYLKNPTQEFVLTMELEHLRKDGSTVWGEISARPRFNAAGELEIFGITRDIDARKKLESQLARQAEDQQILLNNIPTQIWYLTDPATCGAVNEAYARFNGRSREEMGHCKLYDVYPKEDAERFIQSNKKVFETKDPQQIEQWVTDKAGETRLLKLNYIPKLDSAGEIEYVVCSAEDITDIRLAQQELLIAKEKAEESSRQKTAFLASMNHELRTPLNHILGFSQILSTTSDPHEILECATHIYKSGESLLKMIQDIFDLALAEQAIMRPRIQAVKCFDHFFDNKANLEDIFESSGLHGKVKLIFSPDMKALHREVSIDVGKVNHVMNNLFRTAVTFTTAGSIEFGFEMTEANTIRYYVKDTGIGIPVEKQDLIFDFFRQADNSNTR